MDPFKGKTPAERNKLIAAILLGVLAVVALAFAFGPGLVSRSSGVTVSVKTSPSPAKASTTTPGQFSMPTQDQQNFDYGSTQIDYRPGSFDAGPPGRNIFAFQEPPPCYPNCPTPYVPPPTPAPQPTPTPYPITIAMVMPQTVYAGQKGFRLEVAGENFAPDTKIYFNQALMPTTFISPQRMTADIPANMIAAEGPKQVIVQSVADASKFSPSLNLNVQPPPKPQYEYVGMISRKFANNDTAYFVEKSKMNTPNVVPVGKRLNDILGGRFRLVSISDTQTVFEDVNLGFRHPLPLNKTGTGGGGSSTGAPAGFPNFNNGRPQTLPGFPNVGIPQPRPNTNTNRPVKKDDDDDDGDDGNRK